MPQTPLQKVLEWILDNIFDSIALAVAIFMFARHLIHPFSLEEIPDLATGILGVMGLLAISGVWDRNRRLARIERLSRESRDLVQRRLQEKSRAWDFFIRDAARHVTSDIFASAARITISGISLTRTTREYMFVLGQRLIAGATIQIIILDPKNTQILEELASRSVGDTSAEYWRNRLDTVVTIVEAISKTPGSTGTVTLGFLPYIPSFGLILIDPGQSHSHGYVELYHHKSIEPTPLFEIRNSDDPYWYDYFSRQAEILWNSCRKETLPKSVDARASKTNNLTSPE